MKCVLFLAPYYCDFPDRKNLSRLRHGVELNTPCVRCMVSGKENFNGPTAHEWLLRETEMGRRNLF